MAGLLDAWRDRRQARGKQTPMLDGLLDQPEPGLLEEEPRPFLDFLGRNSNAFLGAATGLASGNATNAWGRGFQGFATGAMTDQERQDYEAEQQQEAARAAAWDDILAGAPGLDDQQRAALGLVGPEAGAGWLLDQSNEPAGGFVEPPNTVVGGQIYDWSTGTWIAPPTPEGAPADREVRNDQNGVPRYMDTGEPVFPGVEVAEEPINFGDEESLRDNFRMETADYRQIQGHYQRLQAAAANPSAAGDVAMIFGFMKMLDPISVVREGEQATAANAGGVDDRILNIYNRLLTGERLTPDQRADFLGQATALFAATENNFNTVAQRYRTLAQQYGMDPERIFPTSGAPSGGTPTPGVYNYDPATGQLVPVAP